MALGDHLRELRARLLRSVPWPSTIALIVALFFYDQLFDIIYRPYQIARENLQGKVDTRGTISGAGGPLLLQLKMCGVAAVIVTAPYWLLQICPGSSFPVCTRTRSAGPGSSPWSPDPAARRRGGCAPQAPPSTGSSSPRSRTDGCGRPRSVSASVSRAISRRMPSNDERTTALGVSSMMKSTPVRCSSARMLRPSRPMIRPFMSSDASSTSVTVVSAAWLAATRWSASATRLRARRFASTCASSSALPDAARELVSDELLGARRAPPPSPRRRSGPRSARARERVRAPASAPPGASGWVSRSATPCSRRCTSCTRCVELLLARQRPLLDLRRPLAPVRSLCSMLCPGADRGLAGLDLRLAPRRLRVALGLLDDLVAGPRGGVGARRGRRSPAARREATSDADGEPSRQSDGERHARS